MKLKRLSVLIVLMIIFGSLFLPFAFADTNMIETSPGSSTQRACKDLHPSDSAEASSVTQSFKSSGRHNLTAVKLYLFRYGVSVSGNAHAVLYAHSGTFGTSSVPTGAPLATSDNFDVSTLTTSAVWRWFNFTGAEIYELQPDTYYVIAFENPTAGTITVDHYTRVRYDATTPTHPGNYAEYVNGAYTAYAGRDMSFELWGNNTAPTLVNASIPDMDDTDNCYAAIYYNFTATVNDTDGATDIEKIYLRILQESAIRGEVRATDLNTPTPTWAVYSNSTIIELNTTACSFTEDDPWWDVDWAKRILLTFNNSASAENLANFPILVKLTSSEIAWADIQNDGADLRFIDADNVTVLDYEIEDYNETANAAYIWVEVPQIDALSTTDYIWMYYDNVDAADGQNITGTWDDDYMMVQHMVDETTSTILDSTQYDNDGVKTGANKPLWVPGGYIDSAQLFNKTADNINTGDGGTINLNYSCTYSYWVKLKESGMWHRILQKDGGAGNRGFYLLVTNQNKLRFLISPDGIATAFRDGATGTVANGDWHYVVGTYDAVGLTLNVYLDGVNDDAGLTGVVPGAITPSSVDMAISAFTVNGTIDEVRAYNGSRSADWVEAQYLSMTDALISFGSSEAVSTMGVAIFNVAFEWDYTQEEDLEIAVYVEDASSVSAGWTTLQANYTDIINRLVTYNFGANVSSVVINLPIELSGYVRYATTASGNLASSTSPPDGQFTSVQIQDDQEEIVGTDTVIVDGYFSSSFNASSIPRTTMYYAYLDLLDDYVDALAPDGDIVYVTTITEFYISQLIEQAFSVFGILDYIANATAYGVALGTYFVDSITNITQLIVQQFLFVLGIFDFFIDWYTRMMSLVTNIGGIVTGLFDGTGDIVMEVGNFWDYISFSTWIDIVPVVLFIWWVESIAKRGTTQGEVTVFLGDMQTVMNVTSWFLSMFSMIINTVTDLAFRLLGVIT